VFGCCMRAALIGLCAAASLTATSAAADEPFYKGKRLSVLVNYAPGGPTDIEGRLFAKHIGRHIEGQPALLVQNIDGAGGLVGTTYLGEVAPKDGSVVGYLTGAAWVYASEPDKHRGDLKSYEFIAYQPGTVVYYVRTDVEPGMKDATDIVKAKGLVSGGLAADNAKDLLIRLTLDQLGVPYRHVTGYRNNSAARLAVQRNEVHFFSESPPGYRSTVEPSMVKSGQVIPLYYDPGYDGERLTTPKQVEGLALLPFQELYRKVKGVAPSGQLWDVYLAGLSINAPCSG
jgi:tripartite-type tricarboxylate transporter receptor subunit TctC